MSEPITINGHTRKVTIKLPSSYKITSSSDSTIIEIVADPKQPFTGLYVRNLKLPKGKQSVYQTNYKGSWEVTIEA